MFLDGQKLYCFVWDFIDSNMYIMLNSDSALIVDPIYTEEVEMFLRENNTKFAYVILTHEHFDHINGLNFLRGLFPVAVYCHKVCAMNIENPAKNLSDKIDVLTMDNPVFSGKLKIAPFSCKADVTFDDEMDIQWETYRIHMFSTPGHTPGSICAVLNDKYMFTGDTLLSIPTLTRCPSGNKRIFIDSTLSKLKNLENKINLILPGHGNTGSPKEFLKKYEV